MSNRERTGRVVDQKDALSIYFEALLREPADEPLEARTLAEPLGEGTPLLVPPVIALPVVPRLEVEAQVTAPLATPTPVAAELAIEVVEEGPPLRMAGVPEWAATPFQALLFKVSGLTLAVPLAELSGVEEWSDRAVTPMLGKIEWYLGLMPYRSRQVPVVDTAQLVLPQERLEKLVSDETERLGHVVFILDGQWGLACDAVGEVISLTHQEVKWRTSRAKRRWLAGTVLEHMCAIIDPPAFAEMLRTGIADEVESEH